MPQSLTMRRIVLPQAMRVIVPPTGNEVITMSKNTSLVAVIGASDLFTQAQTIGARNFTTFQMLIVASQPPTGATAIARIPPVRGSRTIAVALCAPHCRTVRRSTDSVWAGWYFAVCFAFNGHNNEVGGAARRHPARSLQRVALRGGHSRR